MTITDDLLASRYRLEELLGRGGLADVYAAVDTTCEDRVAVKVLRSIEMSDGQRFEREARVLEALHHDNVVRLRDVGEDGDRSYLVLDLVDGPTLSALLADGPMECERAIDLCAEVADALAHAHATGIVHRDVKPGNILLGDDGRALLTDFGIARLVDHNASTDLTATGHVIGTAAYLAPEQVRGEQAGAEADVYALGLVLLECCSGERAFAGTGIESAMARLTRNPELPSEMPTWCKPLVRAMTATDPSARPTAVTVARALHQRTYHGAEDEPTQPVAPVDITAEADPPTQVYALPMIPSPEPAPQADAPTALVAAAPRAGALSTDPPSYEPASPAEAPSPPAVPRALRPARRAQTRLSGAAIVLLVVVIVLAALVLARLQDSGTSTTEQPPATSLTDALDRLEESVG